MAKITKKQVRALVVIGLLWFALIVGLYAAHGNFQVLNPAGEIARKERDLIVFTTLLGLLVVLPVLVMTFYIAWKYREGNTKAKYSPELDHNAAAETLWWGIPTAIIVALSVITWHSSHALDPHQPLKNPAQPLDVQVIALDWKWLFIYPQQGVASVNYLAIPEKTPVNFRITADAPMNSFWIPQLGGQIYAMPGMSTKLHLMADTAGEYRGSSANLSGAGFAGMDFIASSSSGADFQAWVQATQKSPNKLDWPAYQALAKPSQDNQPAVYSSVDSGLYDKVVMQFMGPGRGGGR